MANILDLLLSYKRTTRNNSNISYLFIIYQIILFASSVLGPSTVLLAMQSAVKTVLRMSVPLQLRNTLSDTLVVTLEYKAIYPHLQL
jgi:chitin synthase